MATVGFKGLILNDTIRWANSLRYKGVRWWA